MTALKCKGIGILTNTRMEKKGDNHGMSHRWILFLAVLNPEPADRLGAVILGIKTEFKQIKGYRLKNNPACIVVLRIQASTNFFRLPESLRLYITQISNRQFLSPSRSFFFFFCKSQDHSEQMPHT